LKARAPRLLYRDGMAEAVCRRAVRSWFRLAVMGAALLSCGCVAAPILEGGPGMAAVDEIGARRTANLAVVERYCAAWRAGDRMALAGLYHEDFTLHYFGRNPLAGDHVGKAAALRILGEVGRRTNRRLVEIVDCAAGPERAVVIAREAFERGEERAELERVLVYTIKDGLLHHCWVYDGDQALVDRFLADDKSSAGAPS
jgi:uncharacterized protein